MRQFAVFLQQTEMQAPRNIISPSTEERAAESPLPETSSPLSLTIYI